MLADEMNAMQRWAYYGIEDDYLTNLLEKEETIMADELSLSEAQQLTSLEAIIETGLQTFVDVGQALMEIRGSRLYRGQYGNFEEYCRERWGFKRAHAYRMIEAAEVVSNLETLKVGLPANEAQARPLTGLPAEWQREVWQRAVETAPEGRVTAEHVQRVAESLIPTPDSHPADSRPPLTPPRGRGIEGDNGTVAQRGMSQAFDLIMSQDSEEWYTPEPYILLAREVMGGIDLDPATSLIAQQWIKATVAYTVDDNGLAQPWFGRTWLNPPYNKQGDRDSNAEIWSNRLIGEYQAGRVSQAILLVSNKAGYRWFENVWDQALACFARDLIGFIRPDGIRPGKAKVGSVFFYFGPNLARFAEVFGRIGRVVNSEGSLL